MQRANLGTDKSVPYKKLVTAEHGLKNTSERIRENPLNPRKSAFHAFEIR
ncbi:MAG: hypothetical protein FWG87_12205 [Defluviitaleaceae bacterium]|nr:hypothetical protein [Defluviitaleaceae bacterium]